MIDLSLRPYPIARKNRVAPVLFWAVQVLIGFLIIWVLIGIPGFVTAKIDLALWLIAWIGATLAVGVAALVHGKIVIELPAVFSVRASDGTEPGLAPPAGYQDLYAGYAFKVLDDGRVQVRTEHGGPKIFANWATFVKATR
jgi:hypothetical protein